MHSKEKNIFHITLLLAFFAFSLTGCDSIQGEAKYPTGYGRDGASDQNDIYKKQDSVFGEGGLFGSSKKSKDAVGADAVGVNGFLWRAALDTVSFMPLASADPFGGVILTEWYTAPETPNERLKLNVFIMGRELKSDGVKVKAFRQVNTGNGWADAKVAEDTTRKLEDAILTRARQLRVAHLGDSE
ncbi:MAG: DUF3576 domain-containing protein [Rhodospirillales bacterium]|nr:DUF3576 domain-containing protein [Alphaproteobacteria bacterium]MCB1839475.1 DUF3576 domain-containing protein [Alphaproteobacteria bacterium]MCB9977978.1 DUF3576 domain-containing protein [Rhodospirillales bacterium]